MLASSVCCARRRSPSGYSAPTDRVRLIYAPKGESSGHLTFDFSEMALPAGGPILAAFDRLLSAHALFADAEEARLPALLAKSREAQAEVSTKLSRQVLAALYELLRGFVTAHARIGSSALIDIARDRAGPPLRGTHHRAHAPRLRALRRRPRADARPPRLPAPLFARGIVREASRRRRRVARHHGATLWRLGAAALAVSTDSWRREPRRAGYRGPQRARCSTPTDSRSSKAVRETERRMLRSQWCRTARCGRSSATS